MNIKIHYDRGGEQEIKKPIDISIIMKSEQSIVFEQQFVIGKSGTLEFFCDYPPPYVRCEICCNDPDIFHHPLTVEMLEFDDFYQLKSFAHHGVNHYDAEFFEFAKQNNLEINDCEFNNCLFFTGNLSYQWSKPIA